MRISKVLFPDRKWGAFCIGEYAKEFSIIAGDVKGSIFNKLRWKLQLDQEEFFNEFSPHNYAAIFKFYYLKSFKVSNDKRKKHFTPLSL